MKRLSRIGARHGALLALAVLGVAAGGCGTADKPADDDAADRTAARYRTVTPTQVAPDAAAGKVLLVDVREPEEWRAGHAKHAIHVPLGEVAQRLDDIDRRRAGRPVAFICRSGSRSAQASELAVDGGVRPVINVDGGMAAWVDAGLAIVPSDGRVI